MSCEDYCPERDNDFDEIEEVETDGAKKHYDKVMRKLIDDGGLRVENIIELQYMMELIKYVPEKYKDKQEPIAKCLELIINLANQFLILYDKNKVNLN